MVLKSMKQRSSPGPDAIIVFWWRHLTSTHLLLSQFISKLIYDDGADIPSWLPIGKTYLIPKSSDVMNVRKHRPITCLNTIYKIVTTIVKDELSKHCDAFNVIPLGQRGIRKAHGDVKTTY